MAESFGRGFVTGQNNRDRKQDPDFKAMQEDRKVALENQRARDQLALEEYLEMEYDPYVPPLVDLSSGEIEDPPIAPMTITPTTVAPPTEPIVSTINEVVEEPLDDEGLLTEPEPVQVVKSPMRINEPIQVRDFSTPQLISEITKRSSDQKNLLGLNPVRTTTTQPSTPPITITIPDAPPSTIQSLGGGFIGGVGGALPTPGCLDPRADNYNPNSSREDGSCVFTIPGCMDPIAYNFSGEYSVQLNNSGLYTIVGANESDGSCKYFDYGCFQQDAVNNTCTNTDLIPQISSDGYEVLSKHSDESLSKVRLVATSGNLDTLSLISNMSGTERYNYLLNNYVEMTDTNLQNKQRVFNIQEVGEDPTTQSPILVINLMPASTQGAGSFVENLKNVRDSRRGPKDSRRGPRDPRRALNATRGGSYNV